MISVDAPTSLGEEGLLRFVAKRGFTAELVHPGSPTPTVAAAAAAVGTDIANIVKSLLFLADGEPCLVVAAGEGRVAMRALAAALGVSRRKLHLASPDQALDIGGYPVGAMPPFGHRRTLATLVDSNSVPLRGTLFAGGGSRLALLRLDAGTLLDASGGRLTPLTDRVA